MNDDITDAQRFLWLLDVIEYKPPGYDGCDFGRFDLFWRSDNPDLREAIDNELRKG